jgi:hypothetical protein
MQNMASTSTERPTQTALQAQVSWQWKGERESVCVCLHGVFEESAVLESLQFGQQLRNCLVQLWCDHLIHVSAMPVTHGRCRRIEEQQKKKKHTIECAAPH